MSLSQGLRSFAFMVTLPWTRRLSHPEPSLILSLTHRNAAGAPVQVEGSVVGTLCILDTKPREAFSPEEVDLLEHMAVLVEHAVMQHKVSQIESVITPLTNQCQESVIMNQEKQRLRPLIAESTAPVFGMDTAGICNEWNSKAEQVLGFAASDVIGHDFFQTLCPPGEDEVLHAQ